MRPKPGSRLSTRQKMMTRKIVLVTSVAIVIAGLGVFIMQLKNPDKALAAVCDSSYILDWGNPATYTITCGEVNAGNWTVKGSTCTFFSPLLPSGGVVGDPDRQSDITVRINQSGNLDGNDTAWVKFYVNGLVTNTFTCPGDSTSAVFTVVRTITVPAGGFYQISIVLKNDKSNETWQIKNDNVNACLKSNGNNPLPISLGNFTAGPNALGQVRVKWNTFTEKDNHYFTVEHSKTGTSFTDLSRIEGSGNSNSNRDYEYIHQSPDPGINYYRLRQTDYDGTTTLSHIIKTAVSKTSKPSNVAIQVFPNPFTETFSVKYDSDSEQTVSVQLIGLNGKVVYSEQHQATAGENTFTGTLSRPVNKGNYLVQVSNSETVLGSARVVSN